MRVKLKHLETHNRRRREIAALYDEHLRQVVTPSAADGTLHVYHLYVIRDAQRDPLMAELKARDIGTLIHYPIPVHLQESHRDLGVGIGSLPETEKAAREILSLPMYIGLSDADVMRVCAAIAQLRG